MMEREIPSFIKEFSREESPDERKKVAQEIRKKRAEYQLNQKTEGESDTQDQSLEGVQLQLEELSDFDPDQNTKKDTQRLKKDEITKMLSDFYEREKEKWAHSDFSEEDLRKYFSEKNLEHLSLDEYALLLRRFPCEMLTHVTRQGVRDHVGHFSHTYGFGKFHKGFEKILDDGRLHSVLEINLKDKERDEALEKFLNLLIGFEKRTKEEALKILEMITEPQQRPVGTYSDMKAVHMAAEEVADTYYGAENGNEIFIAFPSALIASEYYFSGDISGKVKGGDNDQWIWTKEKEGINIDAGVVFIPAKAHVDKVTGSQYEIGQNGDPIMNTDALDKVLDILKSPELDNFMDKLDHENISVEEFNLQFQEWMRRYDKFLEISEEPLRDILLDEKLMRILFGNKKFSKQKKCWQDKRNNMIFIQNKLSNCGMLFKKATDTISSEEYWENYFKKNPDKKPSKIVYYEEEDPTAALLQWRGYQKLEKRGIEKFSRGISRQQPETRRGVEFFKAQAIRIIERYYEKNETAKAA